MAVSTRAGSRSHSRSRLLQKMAPPNNSALKRDYMIGIALLLSVTLLWNASNFITADMFGTYNKPFLVTYLNTSAFSFYLIPVVVKRLWRKPTSLYHPLQPEPRHNPQLPSTTLPPLTLKETARLAASFCGLWFLANWAVNASLAFTSVPSATILSSMSGFFTLGIGRYFKVETLSSVKLVAVLISFGGVILVSLSDSNATPDLVAEDAVVRPLLGDMMALISAIFYALYVILLKVKIKSEERIDMQLFFGFVGFFNIVALWPVALVLNWTGVEALEWPGSGKVVMALVVNMFITWSSDYLYVISMLKTTPLVVTIGLSLTIPLAVIGDFILGNTVHSKVIVGAFFVFLGFVVVGSEGSESVEAEERDSTPRDSLDVPSYS
ncbi:hypothetical protein CYLTODRAFT_367043 [Cylindrobasidium torrendii FP15055 ss-10]|uniref:EamA domain-containing protein n=1 Tax=Cylindrobasidium torrendii FP15055 ss-10 TaxID=1314674 RepID=A0A0D7BTC2_9AGAR|nr:hypothetical protein CYLTODRAFT_367043 [Cylindrobasidium torrendii FP15055 ss-10]